MKSMVKYGMFASALVLAALLGHLLTERSYDHEPVQNNKSGEFESASAFNPGLTSSPARDNRLEQNNSLNLAKNSELTKKAEQAKLAAIKNSVAIQLDPITAIQAVKLKASQAAAKAPETQQPELTKNKSAEVDSNKNVVAIQNGPGEVAFGRAEAASVPNGPTNLESTPRDSAGADLDMLALLSSLPTLDGQPLGREAIENKTLVLLVWASWCGSCQRQLPNFDEWTHKLNNPDLAVIVLAVEEHLEDIRESIARRPINHPVLIVDPGTTERLQVTGLPATFVVNSRGRLRARIMGELNGPSSYEQQILSVLAETKTNSQKPSTIMKLAGGDPAAQ